MPGATGAAASTTQYSSQVQLRPGGEFWCPRFAAPATWQFSGGTLAIDWGKYGEYVLRLSGDALAGGARGNESDWRKMRFLRAFTPQEALVSASVWRLRSGDEEPLLVQSRADGRFVCPSRPGTFSYRLEGDSVLIEWDSLSNDRLQLDMAAKANGSARRPPAVNSASSRPACVNRRWAARPSAARSVRRPARSVSSAWSGQ